MKKEQNHTLLEGIIPPMISPLLGRDELDVAGLERVVEHLIQGAVNGLFILGTTGEGPSLSYRLRRELISRVCQQVRDRVPVLVGISDTAFVESVNLARAAAESGADAVVVAPPFYLPEGQPELLEYFDHLLPELPLPLYLYNMPALTKVTLEPETVQRLMQDPRIRGIKDSSGNLDYFRRLCALKSLRRDWTVLIGPEEMLAESVRAGGNGGVCGGANLFPRLYVDLHRAAAKGDTARADELQSLVLMVSQRLYRIGRHSSAIIKGLKAALRCLGICNDFMAEPFHRFRSNEQARVEESLRELCVLLQQHNVPVLDVPAG